MRVNSTAKNLLLSITLCNLNLSAHENISSSILNMSQLDFSTDLSNKTKLSNGEHFKNQDQNSYLHATIPLYASDNMSQVLLLSPGFTFYNKRHIYNLGLGFRHLNENKTFFWGVNSFYDHDPKANAHRISEGFEIGVPYVYLSGNIYQAQGSWKQHKDHSYQEKASSGYDIALKTNLPVYSQVSFGVKYFSWKGKDINFHGKNSKINNPKGISYTLEYQPVSLIGLSLKKTYEQKNKLKNTSFSLDLHYDFNQSISKQLAFSSEPNVYDFSQKIFARVERENTIFLKNRTKQKIINRPYAQTTGLNFLNSTDTSSNENESESEFSTTSDQSSQNSDDQISQNSDDQSTLNDNDVYSSSSVNTDTKSNYEEATYESESESNSSTSTQIITYTQSPIKYIPSSVESTDGKANHKRRQPAKSKNKTKKTSNYTLVRTIKVKNKNHVPFKTLVKKTPTASQINNKSQCVIKQFIPRDKDYTRDITQNTYRIQCPVATHNNHDLSTTEIVSIIKGYNNPQLNSSSSQPTKMSNPFQRTEHSTRKKPTELEKFGKKVIDALKK